MICYRHYQVYALKMMCKGIRTCMVTKSWSENWLQQNDLELAVCYIADNFLSNLVGHSDAAKSIIVLPAGISGVIWHTEQRVGRHFFQVDRGHHACQAWHSAISPSSYLVVAHSTEKQFSDVTSWICLLSGTITGWEWWQYPRDSACWPWARTVLYPSTQRLVLNKFVVSLIHT